MRALCLVNQLCVIMPVNPRKNRASSESLYKSIRPQVSMADKPLELLVKHSKNCPRVLPTSRVVYQLLLFKFHTLYEFRFSDWLICTTWHWVMTKQLP